MKNICCIVVLVWGVITYSQPSYFLFGGAAIIDSGLSKKTNLSLFDKQQCNLSPLQYQRWPFDSVEYYPKNQIINCSILKNNSIFSSYEKNSLSIVLFYSIIGTSTVQENIEFVDTNFLEPILNNTIYNNSIKKNLLSPGNRTYTSNPILKITLENPRNWSNDRFSELDKIVDYHEFDLGLIVTLFTSKGFISKLVLSVYSAYGREHPYLFSFSSKSEAQQKQPEVLSHIQYVPSIAWNFKF